MTAAIALVHQARDIEHSIRDRIAGLKVVSVAEAEAAGARPFTYAYTTRLLDQCAMLLSVIDENPEKNLIFVAKPKGIEIWRISAADSRAAVKKQLLSEAAELLALPA